MRRLSEQLRRLRQQADVSGNLSVSDRVFIALVGGAIIYLVALLAGCGAVLTISLPAEPTSNIMIGQPHDNQAQEASENKLRASEGLD
jgi:uncharacterized protein YceK